MANFKTRVRRARPFLIGVAVAAVCLLGFFELAEDYSLSPAVAAFDTSVASTISGWRTPLLTRAFIAVTSLASTATATLMVAVVALSWYAFKRKSEALTLVVTVGGGALLGLLAKDVYLRERPLAAQALIPLPTGYSFPSGHALDSLLFYGIFAILVGYALKRGWPRVLLAVASIAVIVLVGVSRVYLGVHYPSDVVASWLLGGAWLALCAGAFESWGRRG
ncbi:MAG: phosphatase PAP2 family protein [Coriobacteriia bacterium]